MVKVVFLSECVACRAMARPGVLASKRTNVGGSGPLSRIIEVEMQLSWACCGVGGDAVCGYEDCWGAMAGPAPVRSS